MTWPQVTQLSTHASDHRDVYFNMWRLGWFAHALANDPTRLLDGNIFHPEPRAMTFSDAMVVEGLLAAPLLWVGLPRMLVHNLMLLGAIVSSAVGMFVLVRHLTASFGAGLIAGVIFAFAPYRFEHYMHMELQWTTWTPWAFWALQRTFETGRRISGLLTGVFVALQMLSSIYYGMFLGTLLGLVAALQLIGSPTAQAARALRPLVAGGLAAAIVCGAYAVPYMMTKREVGGRAEHEVSMFSARPSNYLISTPDNILYGEFLQNRGRPERRLFPGTLAALLALVGLLLRPPPLTALAYFLAMIAAFEMSLGLSGYSYRFLYDHAVVFQGFRAAARLGVFVLFFIAALAGYGYALLADGRRPVVRRLLLATSMLVLVAEYRVRPLGLVPYPNQPSPLHAWLATAPPGVVAELPLPTPDEQPGWDARTSYLSTFHWQPIVNGYSGFVPESYVQRITALEHFPDERSLSRLQRDNVRYLVVNLDRYTREHAAETLDRLKTTYALAELGRFKNGAGEAVVFAMR